MTEQNRNNPTQLNIDGAMCAFVQQRLPDFLHRDQTAVEHRQILDHLARCDSCAQSVQEARLLDADLQAEADRYQPRLSSDASLRIQNKVYRRMQRSLVWQRTGQVLRFSTAVATLILLLGGSFLFGRFWLPYLATESPAGESTSLSELPLPGPTAVPTSAPAIATLAPPETASDPPAESGILPNGRVNAWDHWVAAAPGQTPEELALTIVSAALANDERYLNTLFVGMGAGQQPTANMWLSITNRCPHSLSGDVFTYARHPIPLSNVTSVSVRFGGVLVSEIKMRQIQGEWFATFTRAPVFNPCLLQ